MSNNYSQFSEAIKDLTEDEKKWIRSVVALDYEDEDDLANLLEMLPEADRFLGEDSEYLDCWPGFEMVIREEDNLLWITSRNDDWFNMSHVLLFIQTFLRKFRPDYTFIMTWADWCDKPKLGAFGGGAARIMADGYEIKDAWSFRNEWEKNA